MPGRERAAPAGLAGGVTQPGVRLEEYLARSRAIPGWLHLSDALVFRQLALEQARAGLRADVLEIGAYHGRSSILLGYLLQEGERLFVCDLFEDQPPETERGTGQRHYARLTRAAFEKNYLTYHAVLPEILACPSTALLADRLVEPPFRLVHIDGSHEPAVVAQDVRTAATLLGPGGVVVFEDDHGVHVPRLPPAVRDALDRGSLQPLCVTPGKTYALAGPDVLSLRSALGSWAAAGAEWEAAARSLAGHEVLALYPLPRREGVWRGLERKLA